MNFEGQKPAGLGESLLDLRLPHCLSEALCRPLLCPCPSPIIRLVRCEAVRRRAYLEERRLLGSCVRAVRQKQVRSPPRRLSISCDLSHHEPRRTSSLADRSATSCLHSADAAATVAPCETPVMPQRPFRPACGARTCERRFRALGRWRDALGLARGERRLPNALGSQTGRRRSLRGRDHQYRWGHGGGRSPFDQC